MDWNMPGSVGSGPVRFDTTMSNCKVYMVSAAGISVSVTGA